MRNSIVYSVFLTIVLYGCDDTLLKNEEPTISLTIENSYMIPNNKNWNRSANDYCINGNTVYFSVPNYGIDSFTLDSFSSGTFTKAVNLNSYYLDIECSGSASTLYILPDDYDEIALKRGFYTLSMDSSSEPILDSYVEPGYSQVFFTNNTIILVGSYSLNIRDVNDKSSNWIQRKHPFKHILSMCFSNDKIIITGLDNIIAITTDFGINWTIINMDASIKNCFNPVVFNNTLYFTSIITKYNISEEYLIAMNLDNKKLKIQRIRDICPDPSKLNNRSISQIYIDDKIIMLAYDMGILYSTDNGAKWHNISPTEGALYVKNIYRYGDYYYACCSSYIFRLGLSKPVN